MWARRKSRIAVDIQTYVCYYQFGRRGNQLCCGIQQSPPIGEKDEEERDEDKFEATTREDTKTLKNTEDFSLSRIRSINIPERRYDGAFDLGGSRLQGNTNTAALNASLLFTIWTKRHRFHTDGKYNFASADGEETANNARLNLRYDYFFTKNFFSIILSVLAFSFRFPH